MTTSNQARMALRELFPAFRQTELIEQLLAHGQLVTLVQDEVLLHVTDYIRAVPLLLQGALRVYREDELGREVLLYHIRPGESCAMSLSCALQDRRSRIRAVAEADTRFLAVPVELLMELNRHYPSWQTFVALTFSQKFEEVLRVVEGAVFQHLDERLLNYLREVAQLQGQPVIIRSHQRIADDLATSREVISRLLKQLAQDGRVDLARGQITLREAL
ncbi:MAG: Crp/Fnr family transcriptional regulator [Lewinella sp.]|nr:Crp/Fnr family transcriptional regulator [Lewinella sp.]